MSINVQIISRGSIKPSSPTPPHLKTFNFSFLDQIAPTFYIPILLFYAGNNNIESLERCCHHLKISLSETLTSFYPLAGRIANGNTSIECNDEGVDYLEARVSAQLLEVIKKPNIADVLKLLLPSCHESHFDYESELGSKVVLAIQVNVFDCGGIVISVCMSHKIADSSSTASFINCWATKARNSNVIIHPISGLSSLFPQRGLLGYLPSAFIYKGEGNIVTKRFVFESSKIASLRAKASHASYVTNPTRVEVVSAFIWRRFIALAQAKDGSHVKEHAMIHAVNLREKMVPPPSQVGGLKNTLGNLFASTFTESEMVEGKKDSHILVGKIRDAIRKIDGEYVKTMQYGDKYLLSFMGGLVGVNRGEMGLVIFSSWCRFPFYEADFGWGKPIWIANSGFPCKDLIIFIDTPSGDGIEAWVNMLEEDMAELEQDEEFLEYVSLDPNA